MKVRKKKKSFLSLSRIGQEQQISLPRAAPSNSARRALDSFRGAAVLCSSSIFEKNWNTSHLAAIGVAQAERDYVGRWHVASCSIEYVGTAQHVVWFLISAIALTGGSFVTRA